MKRRSRPRLEQLTAPAEILAALNSIPVSQEDLERVIGNIAIHFSMDFSSKVLLKVIRDIFHNDTQKGVAVLFRMEALSDLLQSRTGLTLNDEVLAVVAEEPLVKIGGMLTFDSESILKKIPPIVNGNVTLQ